MLQLRSVLIAAACLITPSVQAQDLPDFYSKAKCSAVLRVPMYEELRRSRDQQSSNFIKYDWCKIVRRKARLGRADSISICYTTS